MHPELAADLSDTLLSRKQGKSCFNFKKVDGAIFQELAALVDAGVAQFERDGRL